jgi:hypothetical protein
MRFNKNRLALLAGIDDRDQYFGKTLRENFSHGLTAEAEDELDAAEEEAEEAPLDAEEGEDLAEEGGEEEMVSKEEIATAVADVLGVDAEELTALVSGEDAAEEGGEDAAEEGGEEVADLELEGDVYREARIRKVIRKEIAAVIREAKAKGDASRLRKARRAKSVAVAMGFKK